MQDRVEKNPNEIAREIKFISDYSSDIARRDAHINDLPIVGKSAYEKRTEFGAAIVSIVQSQKYIGQKIGTYCGFDIIPEANNFFGFNLSLVGACKYNLNISSNDVGTVMRMDNVIKDLENEMQEAEMRKIEYKTN